VYSFVENFDSELVATDSLMVEQLKKLNWVSPRTELPSKKNALISTPRCGSSFFSNIIKNTGHCGYPAEWINPRKVSVYGKIFGLK
jgi:hypothetical protein